MKQRLLPVPRFSSLSNQILHTYRSLHRASDPQGIMTAFHCAGIYKANLIVERGKRLFRPLNHVYAPETNRFLRVPMNRILTRVNEDQDARDELQRIVFPESKRIKLSQRISLEAAQRTVADDRRIFLGGHAAAAVAEEH